VAAAPLTAPLSYPPVCRRGAAGCNRNDRQTSVAFPIAFGSTLKRALGMATRSLPRTSSNLWPRGDVDIYRSRDKRSGSCIGTENSCIRAALSLFSSRVGLREHRVCLLALAQNLRS
jgi:hypothetical protein